MILKRATWRGSAAARAAALALIGLAAGAHAADLHKAETRSIDVAPDPPLSAVDAWICGEARDRETLPRSPGRFRPKAADPSAPWAAKLEIVEEKFADGAMTISNCSAAVLAPGWLVTAAHCVGQEGWISVRATLGAKDSGDPGAIRSLVSTAICHERFDPRSLAYDVALLRLERPLPTDFPTLRIATLGEIDRLARGDAALSAGWGRVSKQEISRLLRKAQVEVVDPSRSGDGMIVAAPVRHEDSLCIGESGAPLVADLGSGPALFGVFSSVDAYYDPGSDTMVELCHGFEARSYFTGLGKLRGWIDKVMALCERDPKGCVASP